MKHPTLGIISITQIFLFQMIFWYKNYTIIFLGITHPTLTIVSYSQINPFPTCISVQLLKPIGYNSLKFVIFMLHTDKTSPLIIYKIEKKISLRFVMMKS
jgi:hypothetical protein